MASSNGKQVIEPSPNRSSRTLSVETHRTRRSQRSRSRSKDRSSKRHRSRSRERRSDRDRSYRDRDREKVKERRSRSRERSHREKDRDREDREKDRDRRRDRDDDGHRRHRDHRRADSRNRERDDDRDYRERRERRRKRGDDMDASPDVRDQEERSKRLREEAAPPPPPPPPSRPSLTPPPPPPPLPPQYDPLRAKSRDSDRRSNGGPRDYRSDRLSPMDADVERRGVPSPPPIRRPSPTYDVPIDQDTDEPKEEDSEARSVFVSQLAARMTARDLGYFFEDKLGESTVMDSRIVTDRLSRRSKGIAYVEFRSIDLVDKAIALSGTIVMGLPIMIQHTEAERNKTHAGDGSIHLPPGASGHGATLYVGSLHFNLTESDIKQVFEPFGELEFVDLHKDPMTGRSKGYAFIQYKRAEDAKMALEQMEGFELAGRTLRVNTVHEKGQTRYTQQDSLEENGGGNLNAASRQALMQKLARIDTAPKVQPIMKPTFTQAMTSKSMLLRNMFDPEEETEPGWDKELADDVKSECEGKYGRVTTIKVETDSDGEIYVQFDSVESAKKAIDGLNGRWFGGRQISATFISDAIMQAHR